ncbi:MAG: PAS domain S-box protein [Candidatus Thorarchaeota archaeon]
MTRVSENEKSNNKDTKESEESDTIEEIQILQDKMKRLENELLISERKSLSLFELTNDALFIIDLEGNYIDVNQRAAELLEYNKHDMIGMNMLNFIVSSEHENSKVKLAELKAGKILPIYRRLFRKRDGSIFQAEINAAVVQDEEGNPAYIQSAVRDISERVEAEDALEKERIAYHLIAEAIIYSADLKEFCERCLTGLTKILDFDSSTIRVYEQETRMLVPVAIIDLDDDNPTESVSPQSIDSPHHIFSLAARSKRAIISPRYEDRMILAPFKDKMEKMNIYSLITWPLLDAKENILGVLELESHKHKEIPEKDLIFFETIAKMFTVAFERKRAEETLKESEEKYRSFAQNFQGIAYRLKSKGEPVFYNGAVEEISGYTQDELLFNKPSWTDLISKEFKKIYLEQFKNLTSDKCSIIDLEYKIISKNGMSKWVHEIGQTICDEKGAPIWIQGAIYDISDKRRALEIQTVQRKLGISLSSTSDMTEALQTVLEALLEIDVIDSGSIFVLDKNTGFLNLIAHKGLSKNYLEKIAYFSTNSPFTQAILSGKPVYADYSEIESEQSEPLIQREGIHSIANIPIISEGKIVAVINLVSHTIGHIPITTRNALENIASQISGSIARIRAEEAFRDSDERYRFFVQNFQGIAYRTKEDFKPIFFHGAVEQITGYTPEELLSRKPSWSDIIHPYDKKILLDSIQEVKDNAVINSALEYRIITKKGEIIWIQDIFQAIYMNSKLLGVQGSIQNITDRKEAQNEIQQLYQDLERRVDERTEQLTLINKELTAFSYSVSHDLRTPLRHIGGFTNLLQKRVESLAEKDDRILSYTQKIIDSTEDMNELIDGLLTFSRMSRVEMVKIRINLTELVQDVLNDFQVELGNRQVDVSVNFLPDVIGDPSLLRLVLVNLISNAFKFTKNCNVAEIQIGTIPSKEQEKVVIFVRDNGVGFDMKYYDRLFGVFQRLHKNEDFEGTGIGLATVQRVIRRMGGSIWAEGAVDKGSTFFFSIQKADES